MTVKQNERRLQKQYGGKYSGYHITSSPGGWIVYIEATKEVIEKGRYE